MFSNFVLPTRVHLKYIFNKNLRTQDNLYIPTNYNIRHMINWKHVPLFCKLCSAEDSSRLERVHWKKAANRSIFCSYTEIVQWVYSTDHMASFVLFDAGDDCISIQTGCSNIYIHNVNCGPGHGISIGGLGRDNTKACVSNVTVRDVNMFRTMTGVRIKTWQVRSIIKERACRINS